MPGKGRGVVLVLIVIVFALLLTLGTLFLTRIHRQTQIVECYRDALKAGGIAQAGLEAAFKEILLDPTWSSGFPPTPFGGGSYTVSVTQPSTETANNFVYAILSGTKIDFQDSTGTVTGDIHAKTRIQNTEGIVILGSATTGVGVTVPSVSLSAWEAIAGNVVGGNFTFTPSGSPYRGLWYVDGNAIIQGEARIEGGLVASGNIEFKKGASSVRIDSGSSRVALIAGNVVKLTNTSKVEINGLVYAVNNIEVEGGSQLEVNGVVIAGNQVILSELDSLDITYDPEIGSSPPPYFYYGGTAIDTFTVNSEGSFRDALKSIKVDVRLRRGPRNALSFAILAGRILDLNYSQIQVNGDVYAVDSVRDISSEGINGSIISGAGGEVPVADITYYETIADNVKRRNFTFTSKDSPYSGIWYVRGNVTIESGVVLNGTIVTAERKDITVVGDEVTLLASENYPVLVSGRDVKLSGMDGSMISGIVYATRDVSVGSLHGPDLVGILIGQRDVVVSGDSRFELTSDPALGEAPIAGLSPATVLSSIQITIAGWR